jgi:hypothetical protein
MAKYTISSGQDIFDISIQNFGDIETGLFQMLTDNDLTLNSLTINREFISGREITLNNENKGITKTKDYFKQRSFTVNNADREYINLSLGDFGSDFNFDFN